MDAFDSVGNEDNGGIFPRELPLSSPFVAINHINRTLLKREARRFARTHTGESTAGCTMGTNTGLWTYIIFEYRFFPPFSLSSKNLKRGILTWAWEKREESGQGCGSFGRKEAYKSGGNDEMGCLPAAKGSRRCIVVVSSPKPRPASPLCLQLLLNPSCIRPLIVNRTLFSSPFITVQSLALRLSRIAHSALVSQAIYTPQPQPEGSGEDANGPRHILTRHFLRADCDDMSVFWNIFRMN